MPEEFTLQLIESSLKELGYDDVAEFLLREAKRKKATKGNVPRGSERQLILIEWFYQELHKGNYLTIEKYLSAVLENDGDPLIEILASNDWKSIVLISLYLIRRTSFFEMLLSATTINELSNYIRDELMPILDELIQTTKIEDKFDFEISGISKIFGETVFSNLNREAESNVLSRLAFAYPYTGEQIGIVFDSKNLFGHVVNLKGLKRAEVALNHNHNQAIQANQTQANQKEGNFLNTTKSSKDASQDANDTAKRVPIDVELINTEITERAARPTSDHEAESANESEGTSSKVKYGLPTKLRTLLVDKLLSKIFKISGFKTFDTVYEIPKNYLNNLVNQSLVYQKLQHPYYLFPRTKEEKESCAEEIDNELILRRQQRQLHEHYKLNVFPHRLQHVLSHHQSEVWSAKFSPLGKFLVTGSLDGKHIIYDVLNNFKVIKILESSDTIDNFAFVPFSPHPTPGKAKAVVYCAWDPSEHYLVSCGFDNVIRIWSVGELHNLHANKRITRSMDLTSSTVIANQEFGLVACFTMGSEIRARSVEFLQNSEIPQFIVSSPDKVLKAFDIEGQEVFDFYGNIEGDEVNGKAPTDDVSMNDDDEDNQKKINSSKSLQKSFKRINDVAITPDGKILVTANDDSQLQFYLIPDFSNINAVTKRLASISLKGKLTSCSISKNGKYILVSSGPEELEVWDISGLYNDQFYDQPILYRTFVGHRQGEFVVRSSFGYLMEETEEEELVLSGSDDGYIYYWKLHTGQLIGRSKGHIGCCNTVDWNTHGKFTAAVDYGKLWCSVGDDKEVKIWGL